MNGSEYRPTRTEIERAWVMRQANLDNEAGVEPDPLTYTREFRAWLASNDDEATAPYKVEIERLRAEIDSLRKNEVASDD